MNLSYLVLWWRHGSSINFCLFQLMDNIIYSRSAVSINLDAPYSYFNAFLHLLALFFRVHWCVPDPIPPIICNLQIKIWAIHLLMSTHRQVPPCMHGVCLDEKGTCSSKAAFERRGWQPVLSGMQNKAFIIAWLIKY